MFAFSLQQEIAYGILTFFTLVIIFFLLRMLYNLLVHLFHKTQMEEGLEDLEYNAIITN